MPLRQKRKAVDFDPNRSDSEDETFSVSVSKKSRKNPRPKSKPARKKRKRANSEDISSGDGEISSTELSVSDSLGESDQDEEPELGASGRPRRSAAKNKQPIIDVDTDGSVEEFVDQITRSPRKPSLWVKLRAVPQQEAKDTSRKERLKSESEQHSRLVSSGAPLDMARRSSRLGQSNVELTSLLQPTMMAGKRPVRGGKGLKRDAELVDSGDEENNIKDQQSTDELQRDYPRLEVAASHDSLAEEIVEVQASNESEKASGATDDANEQVPDSAEDDSGQKEVPESVAGNDDEDDDEDEQSPVARSTRSRRPASQTSLSNGHRDSPQRRNARLRKRNRQSSHKSLNPESSDFDPNEMDEGEDDELSDSESSPRKLSQDGSEEHATIVRGTKRRRPNTRSRGVSDESDDQGIQEELRELVQPKKHKKQRFSIIMEDRKRSRRARDGNVNYDIAASNAEMLRAIEEDEDDAPLQTAPSRRAKGNGAFSRSLFSTYGPFGGAEILPPVLGGPTGLGAVGGAESDSSDDDRLQRPKRMGSGIGGLFGATPTSAHPGGIGLHSTGHTFGNEVPQGLGGTPGNLGKYKDKQPLVDADPLGIDQNVSFDGVGGLNEHINRLKEMVALPLLYPEVFQRIHVTPPRGVLFHGPPGTGKTLLARALANSVSSQGKKVTFYMRKGADALSKWVGEAERQLRLLFDEARRNQPSIIFFDEIDGLAPVRSSKQEQIHASIVSTLLALMDGMDGRGQVIVIGATNRPDSVDPALRRPGRFDREFYFSLPNIEARRSILDIHTQDWRPPLSSTFKDEIAKATKGYGGADIRALCTEAALNAVQRRYPQIYKSDQKLIIDPSSISIGPKDFMISIKNMIPSSERSASSGAAPLSAMLEPLLRDTLQDITNLVANILPVPKRLTALQEAQFEEPEGEKGIQAEQIQQNFDHARLFRPRLLIKGPFGMGQQYLARALLNHLEGLHVQAFDLATLLSDSTRSSEAAIIQLFAEVRRHKPSVIYIPNVDIWYQNIGVTVRSTFCELLQALAPTDPVLILAYMSCDDETSADMMRSLFSFKRNSRYHLRHPGKKARQRFFMPIKDYIETSPVDFPNPDDRKPRKLQNLMPAPPDTPKEPLPLSKEELKARKKRDRFLLNKLKIFIQPIMDQVKAKYRKFRLPLIEEKTIRYLFEEDDPDYVTSDLPQNQRLDDETRLYEKSADARGIPGLKEVRTGKFFYNLDVATIEKRLSNGYYKRPHDFLIDVKKLAKDARTLGDEDRILKANELMANVEVDVYTIEVDYPGFIAELDHVYQRELKREKEMVQYMKQKAAAEGRKVDHFLSNVPPPMSFGSTTDASPGPIKLGQPLTNGLVTRAITSSAPSSQSNGFRGANSDLSNSQGNSQSTITSIECHNDEDVPMTSSQDADKDTQSQSSFGPSAQTRPPDTFTGVPTTLAERRAANDFSQDSVMTSMAPGSQPADYANYASTTSSEKRASGSTGDRDVLLNSQLQSQTPSGSQGDNSHPDFSEFPERTEPNSQLPDTATNSQSSPPPDPLDSQRSHSQGGSVSPPDQDQLALPTLPRESSINSLLNEKSLAPRGRPPQPAAEGLPPVNISETRDNDLLALIVDETRGCSVEQLEQLNSLLMDVVWRNKGEWDRVKVAQIVEDEFRRELEEITFLQGVDHIEEESSFELTQRSAS